MKLWRRETSNFIVGAVIVLLLAVAGWFIWTHLPQKTTIRIESAAYQVDIAYTKAARDKNLDEVQSIDTNGGLLLVYSSSERWTVTPKSMVDLDIIWLDDAHRVVHIVRGAKNDETMNMTYTPLQKAKYVLEIPAGSAKQSGIKVGSTAIMSVDESRVE